MTTTEVVSASQLRKRVVERILDLRNPNRHRDFKRAMSAYRRALGKRNELTEVQRGMFGEVQGKRTGFYRLVDGKPVWVARPHMATLVTYYAAGGYKGFGGDWEPSRQVGLLTDSAYNRDIRNQRVDEYAATMSAGGWHTLLSDPIAITADGQVVNGQHRLAAVWVVDPAAEYYVGKGRSVEWTADYDPQFLVVWDVDPIEALHADGSHRTPKDEAVIATKLGGVS